MSKDSINIHLTRKWHEGTPHLSGTIFDGMKKLTSEDTQNRIRQLGDTESIIKFLKQINGFFSIVKTNGNSGWMAVDRIRSLPLFYGQYEGKLFISDDARWVREHVHDNEMDPIAREEFLACGYVTGSDTLFPNVKQVQAGKVVFFKTGINKAVNLKHHRYYRHNHGNFFEDDEKTIHQKYQQTLISSFERLISFANGRPLIVPLSGGYDSRLIVMMLKQLGYSDVIAFSYGKKGNKEAEISQEVSKRLNVRWEYVPYSRDFWQHWNKRPELKYYFQFADGLSSLPHIQNWAIQILKEESRIPKDAIVIPGHSAGSIAGEKSVNCIDIYREFTTEDRLVSAIINYHYSLNNWRKKSKDLDSIFRGRVRSSLGALEQYYDHSSAFESWDMSERQAKFIVNSVRIYDYLDFEWWLPYWDKEYVNFWSRIKPELRIGKRFHIQHVNEISEQMNVNIKKNASEPPKMKQLLASVLKKTILPRYLLRKLFPNYLLRKNITATMGRFLEKEVVELMRRGHSSNGVAAYYYICSLEEDFREEGI